MIVDIAVRTGDDERFLTAVNGLVARIIEELDPDELVVTRVDKWFDHKWLGFSGRGRVGLDGWPGWRVDVALDEFFQDHLTFPPFAPGQTEVELSLESRDGIGLKQGPLKRPLLSPKRGHSARNLQNRVSERSNAGLYVWFTSHTQPNGRGAVMIYRSRDGAADGWYASFAADREWRLGQCKGISRETVTEWFPLG